MLFIIREWAGQISWRKNLRNPVPYGPLFLAAFAITALLLIFCDKNGYEGDDLNSLVPLLHFDAARGGDITIYRLAWQPLTYAFGASMLKFGFGIGSLFLIPPICIGIATAILLFLLARHFGVPITVGVIILLFTPEIFWTGMYYNSSAPAFLFAVLSITFSFESDKKQFYAIAAGLAIAIAILFRIDFILLIPILLLILIVITGDIVTALIAAISLLLMIMLALLVGLLDPAAIWDTYQSASNEIALRANQPGWDAIHKLRVATLMFSPLGWAVYSVSSVWLLWRLERAQRLRAVLIILAGLPLFQVVPSLLSAKYLLPAYSVLPLVAGLAWREAEVSFGKVTLQRMKVALTVCTLILCFVGFEVDISERSVQPSASAAPPVGTHDGRRSWSGYFYILRDLAATGDDRWQAVVAKQLVSRMLEDKTEIVFIGSQNFFAPGGAGWRHAQLALSQIGAKGQVVGPGLIRLDLKGNALWLLDPKFADTSSAWSICNACPVVEAAKPNGIPVLRPVSRKKIRAGL